MSAAAEAAWKSRAKSAERRCVEYEAALSQMQERAQRAERGAGLGQCQACRHWRREMNCFWGYCTLTEKVISQDWPWRGEPGQRIATKENFGCIRFEQPA